MDSSVSPKDEIWFLRVCHYFSTGLYLKNGSWYIRKNMDLIKIHTVYLLGHFSSFSGLSAGLITALLYFCLFTSPDSRSSCCTVHVPSILSSLIWSSQLSLAKNRDAVFPNLPLVPLWHKYRSKYFILENPWPMIYPGHERPSFTPTSEKRQFTCWVTAWLFRPLETLVIAGGT